VAHHSAKEEEFMGKRLFVGNLPYTIDDASLESQFSSFGKVESARVVTDRDTGRSKGFGFVEMATDDEASKAIDGMNGQPMGGRNITVSEARPQAPREGGSRGGPRGGGGGRGFGGGGGGGNRY
jgi:RNA recognition motif-containing protein